MTCSASQQELLSDYSNLYSFQSQFCYTTADFAIYCAQFESMEILNIIYIFSIHTPPAAVYLAVFQPSAEKVW